jgi:signal transduction histidine kinase/phage shock protein PspC (stress-responsive transcriptional regulator)
MRGVDDETPRATHLFARSAQQRLISGVAGGFAERVGVDPLVVRLAVVLLTLAGGAGVFLYLAAWALSAPADEARVTVAAPISVNRTIAIGCFAFASLAVLRSIGFWVGDALLVPAAILAIGTVALWSFEPAKRRLPYRSPIDALLAGGRVTALRVVIGIGLVLVGLVSLAARGGTAEDLRRAAAAVGLAAAGAAVAVGPVIGRLSREAADERRERIRSETRAEVAAHLHDSVLQTLAMIQRSSNDPRRMLSLARRQERELRAWLYGSHHTLTPPTTLARAIDAVTEEVEAGHDVRIDAVIVGDLVLDETLEGLVAAVREATVNAAKHAGVADIAVYVEVEDGQVTAFIRDRGRGFSLAAVPSDRQGIRGSIQARIVRLGGTAEITSEPGAGTEVQIHLPLTGAGASA